MGIEVAPMGIEVAPMGIEVAPMGIEVAPMRFEVAPMGNGCTNVGIEVALFCLFCTFCPGRAKTRWSANSQLPPPGKPFPLHST